MFFKSFHLFVQIDSNSGMEVSSNTFGQSDAEQFSQQGDYGLDMDLQSVGTLEVVSRSLRSLDQRSRLPILEDFTIHIIATLTIFHRRLPIPVADVGSCVFHILRFTYLQHLQFCRRLLIPEWEVTASHGLCGRSGLVWPEEDEESIFSLASLARSEVEVAVLEVASFIFYALHF